MYCKVHFVASDLKGKQTVIYVHVLYSRLLGSLVGRDLTRV